MRVRSVSCRVMTTPKKTAVVTGASRGIGRAVALAFVQQGYDVWAVARSAEALEKRVLPLMRQLEMGRVDARH